MLVNCDDVHGMLIDALVARRPPADPAVLAHLESCAACRAERAEYESLWHELADVDPVAPASDAAARFARRLAVAAAVPQHAFPSRSKYVGAFAAALVLVALLTGYWAGARHSGARAASLLADNTSTEPMFLLLLHVDSTFRGATSPAQAASMAHEYHRWAEGLAPMASVIDDEKLARDTARWLGPAHVAGAGGDQVDGFFLIHAKDLSTAQQVAATCPHLKYGGRVELREIDRS